MPNPITKVAPDANIGMWPGAAATHPLGLRMLTVLAQWPYVESQVASTLIEITRGDAPEAIEALVKAPNSAKQRKILLDIAATHMDEERLLWLSAIIGMMEGDFKQRNRLAHWMCGVSPNVPNGLLLENPVPQWQHEARRKAIQAKYGRAFHSIPEPQWSDEMRRADAEFWRQPRKHIFVYIERDFKEITENFNGTVHAFFCLNRYLQLDNERSRDQELTRMQAVPRFLPTLEKLRRDDQKTPPAEPPQQWFAALLRQCKRFLKKQSDRVRSLLRQS